MYKFLTVSLCVLFVFFMFMIYVLTAGPAGSSACLTMAEADYGRSNVIKTSPYGYLVKVIGGKFLVVRKDDLFSAATTKILDVTDFIKGDPND